MTLAQAFELMGILSAAVIVLGVGVKLLLVIGSLDKSLAVLTAKFSDIERRLDAIERHYATPGAP